MRRHIVFFSIAVALLTQFTPAAALKVIRFGVPGTGVGGRPVTGGGYPSFAANQGLLEDEFRKDGIEVKWSYFLQAGPAVNEAFANGLLDFSTLGDQPLIAGRAGGIRNKILLASGVRGIYAIIAIPESRINTVEDLRGKRVSIFKGTANQLAANRILEAHGLTEHDVRSVNMNGVAAPAALASKDIDAWVTGLASAIQYQDQGIGKIVYRSDRDPKIKVYSTGGVQVTEEFEKKYPEIVQRVVNVLVRSAAYVDDPHNREEVFKNWAKSGTPYLAYKRSLEGVDWKTTLSPLLDDYYRGQIRTGIADLKRHKLIRNEPALEGWLEPKYLDNALRTYKLQNFWPRYTAEDTPIR